MTNNIIFIYIYIYIYIYIDYIYIKVSRNRKELMLGSIVMTIEEGDGETFWLNIVVYCSYCRYL